MLACLIHRNQLFLIFEIFSLAFCRELSVASISLVLKTTLEQLIFASTSTAPLLLFFLTYLLFLCLFLVFLHIFFLFFLPSSERFHSKCLLTTCTLVKLYLPSKNSSWWRHLEDVMKTSFVFVFSRLLDKDEYIRPTNTSSEDVFKTSSSRPIYSSWSYVFKTSSRRLQDVLKTSSRRLQYIFKMFWRSIIKLNCSW